jgi:hypothetical protein
MADITTRNQGNVSPEGKANWRGDQQAAPQGGQSIYDSSSVMLAELGSRKVVGDRVFYYAKAAGAIGAGDAAQINPGAVINVTAGAADPAGGKKFTFYFATAVEKDAFAEAYLHCQSGTAANLGYGYRVKSHPAVATTSTGSLTLYDPLKRAVNTTDSWTLTKNIYDGLTENTAGTATPAGVAPIAVTSGDYFWLQTWGPGAVKNSAVAAAARSLRAGATGQVQDYIVGTTASASVIVGRSLQVMSASQYGMAFIQINP